ncbi:hypothetical protein ACFLYB_04100 [Chloroflexota bacterium]
MILPIFYYLDKQYSAFYDKVLMSRTMLQTETLRFKRMAPLTTVSGKL